MERSAAYSVGRVVICRRQRQRLYEVREGVAGVHAERRIGRKTAGLEPAGDGAGFGGSAAGEDVIMHLGGKAQFVGMGFAPFLDDRCQDLFPLTTRVSAEVRQLVENVIGGNVATGKLVAEASNEQFPPDRGEASDAAKGMIGPQVRQEIAGKPLLTLFCPVATGAAALGGGGFGCELGTQCGEGGLALFAFREVERAVIRLGKGSQEVVLGGGGGFARATIGGSAGLLIGGLGGGLEDTDNFRGAIRQRPGADRRADFGDEGRGEDRGAAEAARATCALESLNHTPVGEGVRPGIDAECAGHLG